MSAVRRERAPGFRWAGTQVEPYGPDVADATRQVLFDARAGLACEVRYFELAPGARSRLERHAHAHAVVILRGRGRVLVGAEVAAVAPRDLVHVPPGAWHELRADPDAPLGFLCVVPAARDRGVAPRDADLAALRRDPEVAAFLDD